jgi:hypothetical protein
MYDTDIARVSFTLCKPGVHANALNLGILTGGSVSVTLLQFLDVDPSARFNVIVVSQTTSARSRTIIGQCHPGSEDELLPQDSRCLVAQDRRRVHRPDIRTEAVAAIRLLHVAHLEDSRTLGVLELAVE